MARRKFSWTKLQEKRAAQVLDITESLREFWPLTLRQVHYQRFSKGYSSNTESAYTALSVLLKWMRIHEKLPWHAIEDRTRSMSAKRGFENIGEFVEQQLQTMLRGYSRCRVQGQDKYVEVWVEKDTLSRLFEDVVWPYCMRCVVCRGYQSVSFIADFYKRAEHAISLGKDPIILYFGDLDASGVQMFEATQETLETEMDLAGVTFKRCGLLPEHIERYNLPNDPSAVKTTDKRYKKFKEKYGDLAVELDAMQPSDLQNLIRESIEKELDLPRFEQEKEFETLDRQEIEAFREEVADTVLYLYQQRFENV